MKPRSPAAGRRGPLVLGLVVAAVVVTTFVVDDNSADRSPEPAADRRPVSADQLCDSLGVLSRAQDTHLTAASATTTAAMKAAAQEVGATYDEATLPDDVRAGMAQVVDAFAALDDDTTAQELLDVSATASLLEDRRADAFGRWVGTECNQDGSIPARYLAPRVTR